MSCHLQDDWFTVQRIDEDTFAISEYGHWEQVHSFLLLGDRQAALIDTGLGIDNMRRMTDQLTDKPIQVITTHVHWDHIGSHRHYEQIYVHERERRWLTDGIEGLPLEQIRKDVGRDITKPVPESFDPEQYDYFRGEPAGTLKDGDMIDLGGRTLQVIHTPGHSPGHICLHDLEREYLFTGDLLYRGTIYAHYPTTDPADLVRSIHQINSLSGVRLLFGSHHDLGLERNFLTKTAAAVKELEREGLVRHGTGIHKFEHVAIHF